jgi:hypothetical protein
MSTCRLPTEVLLEGTNCCFRAYQYLMAVDCCGAFWVGQNGLLRIWRELVGVN